jgi:hypothetical protein
VSEGQAGRQRNKGEMERNKTRETLKARDCLAKKEGEEVG